MADTDTIEKDDDTLPPEESTDELERRSLASHINARPIATAQPEPTSGTADLEKNAALSQGMPISAGQEANPTPHSLPLRSGVASLWTKADNIQNPVLRVLGKIGAGAARAIDTAGMIAAPRIESAIPGTQGNAILQKRAQTADTEESAKQAQEGATLEHTQAETADTEAQTNQRKSPQPKVGLTGEEGTLHDLMTGENGQPRMNPDTNQPYSYLEAFQKVQEAKAGAKPEKPEKQNDFEQFYSDWIKDNNFPDSAHNRLLARKQYAAAGQTPQHDPQQLAIGPDGKVINLRPGVTVPQGTKTVSGDLAVQKPSADEQKRADLVENLNENLDQLQDIVKRRPELFGKVAGRITKLKEFAGSNDTDVAALKGIEDRLGMVSQSSHGMRSAQHVEASANSILNSYKNGPDAMLRAISDARKSGATFTQDVEKKQQGAQSAGGEQGPERPTNVPKNFVYKENGPKGRGWYRP